MDARQAIQQQAVTLLSRREYSARELQRKLETRHDADLVSEVVEALQGQGLQSDERFTEVWTRQRVMQGYGPIRVQVELRQKGIACELIEQCLQSESIDWFELARSAFERRFGAGKAGDQKEQAKQIRFLQYRGYTGDQIRYAMETAD